MDILSHIPLLQVPLPLVCRFPAMWGIMIFVLQEGVTFVIHISRMFWLLASQDHLSQYDLPTLYLWQVAALPQVKEW